MHYGRQIISKIFWKTSFKATWDHWTGFIKSGFQYIRHTLHYGVDETQSMFYDAVISNDSTGLINMSAEDGLKVNIAQYEIVNFNKTK